MSAEILRHAVWLIRDDWEGASFPDAKFHLAVAEWLQAVARDVDGLDSDFPDHAPHMVDDEALTVARAYLGKYA